MSRSFNYLFLLTTIFITAGVGELVAEPWPLGTVTPARFSGSCPAGYLCSAFDLDCPSQPAKLRGFYAYGSHSGNPRGVIVAVSGAGGEAWWSFQNPEVVPLVDELRAMGFIIIQVRWKTGWANSIEGFDWGPAHAGCRPASIIKYLYDTYYVPLGIQLDHIGECGFCITGGSHGSNQVTYPLGFYGLDGIVNAAIPSGGPPYSALAKSCQRNSSEKDYWLSSTSRKGIDKSYGYISTQGPCLIYDASFLTRWTEEAHATGGNDYYHPATRFHFLFGSIDHGQQTIASDYYNRLVAEGSPYLNWEIVPDTSHRILATQAGRDAWKNAILSYVP